MTGDGPIRPPRDSWRQVSELLDVAMELPPDARAGWLASLQDLDPAVVAAVEGWLAELDAMQATGFLESRAAASAAGQPDRRRALARLAAISAGSARRR